MTKTNQKKIDSLIKILQKFQWQSFDLEEKGILPEYGIDHPSIDEVMNQLEDLKNNS